MRRSGLHSQHGLKMAARLLAGSQDGEIAGVRPREQTRRQPARGGRADGGDLGRIEDGHGTAVLGLEQQDETEMRGISGGSLRGMRLTSFTPKHSGSARYPGMLPSMPRAPGIAMIERSGSYRAPFRDSDHGTSHELDALCHRQESAHLRSAQYANFHRAAPPTLPS